MKSQEDIIKGSIVHILNLIALRMMTAAFGLAFEGELSNLKHFMSPEDRSDIYEGHLIGYVDLEIELLNTLEDEAVKTVVASMQLVFEFLTIYLIINDLDIMEIMDDPIYMDLADECYEEEALDSTADYEAQKELETLNFFFYNLAIWRCIQMLLTNQTEPPLNYHDIFLDQYFDFELKELTSENKSVALLYNLMRAMELGKIGREI